MDPLNGINSNYQTVRHGSIKGSDQIAVEIQHKGGPGFLVGPERSCERMVPPMRAKVFKAVSKKKLNPAFSRQLSTMVFRPFQCRISSIKTFIIIDTRPSIHFLRIMVFLPCFPARSRPGGKS